MQPFHDSEKDSHSVPILTLIDTQIRNWQQLMTQLDKSTDAQRLYCEKQIERLTTEYQRIIDQGLS